jgi:hypothetical protein
MVKNKSQHKHSFGPIQIAEEQLPIAIDYLEDAHRELQKLQRKIQKKKRKLICSSRRRNMRRNEFLPVNLNLKLLIVLNLF